LDEGWEIGGPNTFADLGVKLPAQHQAKTYLRAAILSRIAALHISQIEAARRIGVPQPKMSNLMTDTASRGFSSDKLMEFATKLGLDIEIHVLATWYGDRRRCRSAEQGRASESASSKSSKSRLNSGRMAGVL
jgi:predicted XRE-type DNA-binding protein